MATSCIAGSRPFDAYTNLERDGQGSLVYSSHLCAPVQYANNHVMVISVPP